MYFNKKVYIVIVNYKFWQDTISCLKSLLRLNYTNYQIVVIDNASPNKDLKFIEAWCRKRIAYVIYNRSEAERGGNKELENLAIKKIRYNRNKKTLMQPIILIQTDSNLYYAGGNNVGIKYALAKGDCDYIWILNNDTIVDKESLRFLVEKAETLRKAGKKIGIIGAKLLFYSNPTILQGIGGKYNKLFGLTNHIGSYERDRGQYDNDNTKIDYVIGASMFVSLDFIKEVGLMSEYYRIYFEELDWLERGKRKGWTCTYDWRCKVYHKEGRSVGSSSKIEIRSELSDYYMMKSRILFTRKFYPLYLWSVYSRFFFTILNSIKMKKFKRIYLILKIIFNLPYP